jgi:hypothetical protein
MSKSLPPEKEKFFDLLLARNGNKKNAPFGAFALVSQ